MAPSESNKEKRPLMLCHRCASDIPVGEARRGEDHKARARKGSKEKSILAGSVWPCLVGKEKLKSP